MRTCGSSCPFPQAPAATAPPHARATGFGDDRGHFTSTTPPSEHIKCLPPISVRIFLHLFCTMNQHLSRALINANSLKNWGRIHALSGLPLWLCSEGSVCSAGAAEDVGSIPGLGRSHGRGHGNPLQYSCLQNPMDRGAWWATVRRVAKSYTHLK